MNRRIKYIGALLFFMMLTVLPVRAQAAWTVGANGSYKYVDSSGNVLKSEWFPKLQLGLVTVGSELYAYKADGSRYTGWIRTEDKTYFADKEGKILKKKWIVSGGKRYFASKYGYLYMNCLVKIGSYYYGFDTKGTLLKGKVVFKKKTYYFSKNSGQMIRKAFVTIDKKKYYFGSDGVLGKKVWVGDYYVNASGYVVTSKWIGDYYVGADGKKLKGLQTINGVIYYFDEKTGKKAVSTEVVTEGARYKFNSKGKGTFIEYVKETVQPSVSVESTYWSDPLVDEETLLSAILYAEAGNQPYYGQVAVGIVITNRMRSYLFPSRLKEVIYQKTQFQPARDGALTRMLKNQSLISDSCKKAAKQVMTKYKNNTYEITVNKKKINLKDFLFFMTQPAYVRLKLSSAYTKLGDHVFFKTWVR